MTTATEPKKFSTEYQIEDDNGNPIGPPQHFEADTQKDLLEMVKAAHKNAAREMYKTKKAVKIGNLITPDPERPLNKYERKPLSADELVRIANGLKDPQGASNAAKSLIEAELGVSFDVVRDSLQYTEIKRRIEEAQEQTDLFLNAHPEYVNADSNKEMILKYLEKRNLAITHKNLELAYEDLTSTTPPLLIIQQPRSAAPQPVSEPVVANEIVTPPVLNAPLVPPAIPAEPTKAPAITEPPEVRARVSSSGLSRSDGSAPAPVAAPKAKGITPQQIASMNSIQYAQWLKDPANREIVKEMDKQK